MSSATEELRRLLDERGVEYTTNDSYYCDKCGKQIDIERDGFAQMSVQWWSRGDNSERMRYRPDFRHREGYEEYMMCAQCANEMFGQLEGMEES